MSVTYIGQKKRSYRTTILFYMIGKILMKHQHDGKWSNFQYSGTSIDHTTLRSVFRITRTNGDIVTFIGCPDEDMFGVSLMAIDDDDHVTRYPVVYFDMPFSTYPYAAGQVIDIADPNPWIQHAVKAITDILELFRTPDDALAMFISDILKTVGDLDSADKLVIKFPPNEDHDDMHHFTAEVKSKKPKKKLTKKNYADAFFNVSQADSDEE